MSSPRATAKSVAKAVRRQAPGRKTTKLKVVASKPVVAKTKGASQDELSVRAKQLATEIEREFAKRDDAISVEAMQALMGTLCRVYSTQIDNGASHTPVKMGQSVSPTAIIHTASALLRAGNLSVYELGFWQNATGR
jgi:hypothetical protein